MKQSRRPPEREVELKRQGWTRQFLANEPRLSEAVELYEPTGYEVHLEPLLRKGGVDQHGRNGCSACFDGFEEEYKIVYTRTKKGTPGTEEDLW
jgi:hypothetical protein